MKTTDKILVGIVAGIVLMVAVALVLTFQRPEPAYQAEDTPGGVTYNYLLALQKGEYGRAYGYLSPQLKGYPESVEDFTRQVADNSWRFPLDAENTLAVESTKITGDIATVNVREAHFSGGNLFEPGQSTSVFEMQLELLGGQWKIKYAARYFAWCWSYEQGCH